jgi:starvation-inducible DNA-binding protein
MAHTISQNSHPALRPTDRQAIALELETALVALIDLSLIGKHAHWNVVGPNFHSLHVQLDEMVDAWREAADAVAERATALGHSPDGRTATVASLTPLPSLDAGPLPDDALVRSLTAILTDAVGLIRELTDGVDQLDTVTGDLLRGITATLEQQLWMIRVQSPSDEN